MSHSESASFFFVFKYTIVIIKCLVTESQVWLESVSINIVNWLFSEVLATTARSAGELLQ